MTDIVQGAPGTKDGPWTVKPMGNKRYSIENGEGYYIARTDGGFMDGAGLAHAHQIAASPLMYAALEAVFNAMLNGGDGAEDDFGWSITKLNKARPSIRASLAAARGEVA